MKILNEYALQRQAAYCRLKERVNNKNMKKIAAIMLALLIAGISIGAVYAYLTVQESVENRLTAASTDIEITEQFDPPDELRPGIVIPKKVAVASHSSTACYVRILVEFSSWRAQQFCEDLEILEGWEKSEDGYYYWKEKVSPGETTGPLFSQVEICSDVAKEDLEKFEILVYAEAVSCGSYSMQDAWKKMDSPD